MPLNDELVRLLENPTESLSRELKRWFDPSIPNGIAKIAKVCLALYNSNGGLFIVGFNDDGSPHNSDESEQIKVLYTQDRIQGIVSRYSSILFEIEVIQYEDENKSAVIVVVPGGVKTPTYVKSELVDGERTLIKHQSVYFRSLDSNHTPSSSEIQGRDWERLIQICVDNREADIGRFIRRHLTSINIESIRSLLVETDTEGETSVSAIREYLDEGEQRFSELIQQREETLPEHGSYQAACIILPESTSHEADSEFLRLLDTYNPRHSGWPPWWNSSSASTEEWRPQHYEGNLEALMIGLEDVLFRGIDYWRINPAGKFYLYRALDDDMRLPDRGGEALSQLDIGLVVARVSEIVSTCHSFSNALSDPMSPDEEGGILHIGIRWKRLAGRRIHSWTNPRRYFPRSNPAIQDEVESLTAISVDVPRSALCQYVVELIRPLALAFGPDTVISQQAIEEICHETFARRY